MLQSDHDTGDDQLDRILTVFDQAQDITDESMPFIKGLWVPTHLLNDIYLSLRTIEHRLEMGRRYEKMTNENIKQSQKVLGEIVVGLLEKDGEKT